MSQNKHKTVTNYTQIGWMSNVNVYLIVLFFFFPKMFSILYVCCGDWPHSKVKENLLTRESNLGIAKTEKLLPVGGIRGLCHFTTTVCSGMTWLMHLDAFQ